MRNKNDCQTIKGYMHSFWHSLHILPWPSLEFVDTLVFYEIIQICSGFSSENSISLTRLNYTPNFLVSEPMDICIKMQRTINIIVVCTWFPRNVIHPIAHSLHKNRLLLISNVKTEIKSTTETILYSNGLVVHIFLEIEIQLGIYVIFYGFIFPLLSTYTMRQTVVLVAMLWHMQKIATNSNIFFFLKITLCM